MERINRTLDRIISMTKESEPEEKTDAQYEKLILKGKEEINLVDISDIIMIERVDGLSRVITKDEVFLTSQPLNVLEEKLDPERFIRCHKSYIIRAEAIKKLEVYGRWTYTVTLKDTDETALMTAAKYDEIKQKFLGNG